MIGPTGVGKTEIARRLANLNEAPFIKVEATKFTEVGYVGRDVESIIRDLLNVAINQEKNNMRSTVQKEANKHAEEKLLDILLPVSDNKSNRSTSSPSSETKTTSSSAHEEQVKNSYERTREKMKAKLQRGDFEDKVIDIKVSGQPAAGPHVMELPSDMGIEQIDIMMQNILRQFRGSSKQKKTMKLKEARNLLVEEFAEQLIDNEKATADAIRKTEENGIVFLDEIDKIVTEGSSKQSDVSRQGVQRDLLPLVEGSSVSTRYGVVKTDHILFIAAGAFHMVSPSDMIPELQGRFPIRVELESLSAADLEKILTEPKSALVKQYKALLHTEGIQLRFNKKAIKTITEFADKVNRTSNNIGARRLITVMEKLLEDILFQAPNIPEKQILIDEAYVHKQLTSLVENKDLSRYIL